MKIVAVNGSHRAGKSTAVVLQEVLNAASARGAQVELVELSKLDIGYCIGCNACLRTDTCAIRDDMDILVGKLLEADGIVWGTPDYFSEVTARMKCMMDRTRPLHMVENKLKGKVAGIVVTAGLNNCGAESAVESLRRFCATHEMLVLNSRPAGPVRSGSVTAVQMDGVGPDGRVRYRRTSADDVIALDAARQLGADMVELIERLS